MVNNCSCNRVKQSVGPEIQLFTRFVVGSGELQVNMETEACCARADHSGVELHAQAV